METFIILSLAAALMFATWHVAKRVYTRTSQRD